MEPVFPLSDYSTKKLVIFLFFFGSDDEEDPLEYDAGFGNIVVVDNLPVVPREKYDKLERVARKIYSQIGVIKEGGLLMPVGPDTQKTLGFLLY